MRNEVGQRALLSHAERISVSDSPSSKGLSSDDEKQTVFLVLHEYGVHEGPQLLSNMKEVRGNTGRVSKMPGIQRSKRYRMRA